MSVAECVMLIGLAIVSGVGFLFARRVLTTVYQRYFRPKPEPLELHARPSNLRLITRKQILAHQYIAEDAIQLPLPDALQARVRHFMYDDLANLSLRVLSKENKEENDDIKRMVTIAAERYKFAIPPTLELLDARTFALYCAVRKSLIFTQEHWLNDRGDFIDNRHKFFIYNRVHEVRQAGALYVQLSTRGPLPSFIHYCYMYNRYKNKGRLYSEQEIQSFVTAYANSVGLRLPLSYRYWGEYPALTDAERSSTRPNLTIIK